MSYPKIINKDFYKKFNEKFKEFRVPKKKKTFEQICFPKEYKHQIQQQLLENVMTPGSPYRGLLIYHKIGSGKTCTSIRIAQNWKKKKMNIIILVPAFLKDNYYDELRSQCVNFEFISKKDAETLNNSKYNSDIYKNIIKKSNKLIDKHYKIYSYNKFFDMIDKKNIRLSNTLMIIDEIQNIVSDDGIYYSKLYKLINRKHNNFKLVIMSGTPIFDKPHEIALTINLLLSDTKMPIGNDFYNLFVKNNTIYNINLFKQFIKGYISYYGGAPSYVYPKIKTQYLKCKMTDYQFNIYKKYIKKNGTDFFSKERIASNFVFPNKISYKNNYKNIKKNIKQYSIKIYYLLKLIKKSKGNIFIYSNFINNGGILHLARILEIYGYNNYSKNGSGKNTFAIWSSSESPHYKNTIKNIFNNVNNIDGKFIKIIIGSPSIKEGISLFNVRQVHILEPYWNFSRLDQIIGRAYRYCSHKFLPKKDRNVVIYIYLSVYKNFHTIDSHILDMAINKKKIIKDFESVLKESAIDCYLFKNAHDNDSIKCDK